jgi:hypothetical protein
VVDEIPEKAGFSSSSEQGIKDDLLAGRDFSDTEKNV